ncbi:beta-1,3-galactosyltransferase 1-like [Tachyglossus aculeatus]|uniref:beta-1,3-galactosyltransferase 1-like n=1 Tax=Tachyglossus aculeatus TaxID=9261 RepID=UPI0018F3B2C1|nr:beta-1,3-galactosyltransferase 1-like [Tachyglossus aculeatus]
MGLEWVARFCPQARYVLKVDGDVFLNPNYLVRLLRAHPQRDFITGYIYRGTGPLRDPASKWYVPRELYPHATYPPYCGGPGYVMSGHLARRLFAAAQTVPLITMEDSFVGLCLRRLGVEPTEPPEGAFHVMRREYERCAFARLVLVHHYAPRELLALWPDFLTANSTCPGP